MRIFAWHVHGSWMTSFVQGRHEYFVPVLADRGPDGRGRAQTFVWPDSVQEVTPEQARDLEVDIVVLQRPTELTDLTPAWLGRRPGVEVPALYVEHNAPEPAAATTPHLLADRDDIPLVHVSHFNALMWDSGRAPVTVIEHGILDPGHRYDGARAHAAAVVNEPVRRGRLVGADLISWLGGRLPLDLFGLGTEELGGAGELVRDDLYDALARRRVYVHLFRWTSLGLSLLEAMTLGMPVVALATTEVPRAVPPGAGVVTADLAAFEAAVRSYLNDEEAASTAGKAARAAALERYGLERFLADFDHLFGRLA